MVEMARPTRPVRLSMGIRGRRFEPRGRDPAKDLATHNAYDALASAGALFKTGMTGTNVHGRGDWTGENFRLKISD